MNVSTFSRTVVRPLAPVILQGVLAVLLSVFFQGTGFSQVHQPIKWEVTSLSGRNGDATLKFTAHLDPGWHLYAQFMEKDGPLPTTFVFRENEAYTRIGNVSEETQSFKTFDETFQMEIAWFKDSAVFLQKVKIDKAETTISGTIEFMVCTDEMCLPPDEIAFAIKTTTIFPTKGPEQPKGQPSPPNETYVKPGGRTQTDVKPDMTGGAEGKPEAQVESRGKGGETVGADLKADFDAETKVKPGMHTQTNVRPHAGVEGNANEHVDGETNMAPEATRAQAGRDAETKTTAEDASQATHWNIFLLGIAGGLMAVMMPCIFPMLPFTIGYFSKQANSKRKAITLSAFYGISIIVVYVGLGLFVTAMFGSDALNALSTNGIFNLFFFLLLMVFAASFLGAFELALPSSWVTMADKRSDRRGLAGIFFMAVTLSLVSFSCTGPIIGTLLVEAAVTGKFMGPAMGMFGFSLALATPFTVFSMFPAWLGALPKSGGWLNSVKVVLGFLEIALALKFLSNVDLAYHWDLLDREIFLALWIIIFGLLGFYLLGKLKLAKDRDGGRTSPTSLFLAIITLAFTMYMVPGLWGAPLKAIAAFLPPQQSQDFDLYSVGSLSADHLSLPEQGPGPAKKYNDLFDAPFGLDAFFDYEEGLAYARKVNKPVILDFTGHACVNCRKMETIVWSDARVLNRLRHDYVLVQLYVDDKTALDDGEEFISGYSGKKTSTIGNKWSDLQAARFGTNAQPYYVLLDGEGALLARPRGANYDIVRFTEFLNEGLAKFRDRRPI